MSNFIKEWIIGKPVKTTTEKVVLTAGAFGFSIVWVNLVMLYISYVTGLEFDGAHVSGSDIIPFIISACILAPLWEELAYRIIPITIAKGFNNGIFLVPVVLLSSIIFGWGHGWGQFSLLMQGVSGLVLALVYLKTGDWKYNIALHAAFNFYLGFLS